MYRLVLADLSLADTFGQVDLSWLPVIKSASMVVSFAQQRIEHTRPAAAVLDVIYETSANRS